MPKPKVRARTITEADVAHILSCVGAIDEAGVLILTAMPENAVVADAVRQIKNACSGLTDTLKDLQVLP
jgi:hypothetical protein